MSIRIFRATGFRHAWHDAHHFGLPGDGGAGRVLGSGVSYLLTRGFQDGSYVGDKLWATNRGEDPNELGQYVTSDHLVLHFRAAFGEPPADYLEVCAFYANAPSTRRGSLLVSHCWVGLGTDGTFRLFRGWTTGSPPTGTLIATADTAIAGMYPGPFDSGHEIRTDDAPTLMRDYAVYVKVHPTDGGWIVWEDGVELAREFGLNTQDSVALDVAPDIASYSIGQRPPQPDLDEAGDLLPGANPFPDAAEYAARYEHLVAADALLGRPRVRAMFPTEVGFYDEWGDPVDTFGRDDPTTKAFVIWDDPIYGSAYYPDQASTYLPADGLFATFLHEAMPALGDGEQIMGVGVSAYLASREDPEQDDLRGAARPLLKLGDELIQGEFRPLWDWESPAWPIGNPNGGSGTGTDPDDFIGTKGFRFYQDWWTLPQLRYPDAIDALEVGVNSGTAIHAWLSQLVLLVVTATPTCTGDPENPFPPEPPPTPPAPGGETPMQVGQWRVTVVPSAPTAHGQFRGETLGKWVMVNGVWQPIQSLEEHDLPADTPWPPYFDLCELLPPGELPPTVELGDPPERLFFCYSHPITQLGPLFTAAPNALGPWSLVNLSQAAARSSYIIGAQGSYSQFLNPNYSRALMLAWIDSHAAYMATLMASPWFYGVQAADDFASASRWPPVGLDVAELSYIIAYWKTKYPGIRVGLRARPAQWPTTYPTGIDFVICQYRFWGGLGTPAEFFDRELALAVTRGWDVLWSMNFQNGGTGGPGNPMTPSQVETCMLQFTSDGTNNHGVGGWHYTAGYFATPGVLDAFAVGRNALAALGAP